MCFPQDDWQNLMLLVSFKHLKIPSSEAGIKRANIQLEFSMNGEAEEGQKDRSELCYTSWQSGRSL